MSGRKTAFLGEGSFGCLLDPPVPCERGQDTKIRARHRGSSRDQHLVGKVFMDREDYEEESRLARIAAKIDPTGEKMLTPIQGCRTTAARIEKHPGSPRCEAFQDYLDSKKGPQMPQHPMYELKMPYGGQRLDKYLRNHAGEHTPRDLVARMIPVFEGVVALAEHRYIHQDIKGPNLLLTPEGRVVIIDFGLMVSADHLVDPANLGRLRHTYFPYPPEYKLYWHLNDDAGCRAKGATCRWIVQEAGKNFAHFGRDRQETFEILFAREQWEDILAKVEDRMRSNPDAELKKTWDRIDVYSVGAVFLDVWRYLRLDDPAGAIPAAFLRGLVHPDPGQRFTPMQALEEARSIAAGKKSATKGRS